jgi:hypothetical protein
MKPAGQEEDEEGREPINDCGGKSVSEASINPIALTARALIAICKLIIPMLQNLVYYFYQSKQNISDYFAIRSELVQMNAYKVQYSTTMADDQKKAVYAKQMKIADRMRKISNKFAIDYNRSKNDAVKLAAEEKKKFTNDDLGVSAPPPVPGQSSLF